ncbi:ABC transporter substrate-binding protein [Cohnella hongkongensis]|uniref:ABC transporter substrate-binding protein n=1 Tax=Cohnella hongkongensis TaxID=178337 RepID=A0ABV9FHR4_9BACL
MRNGKTHRLRGLLALSIVLAMALAGCSSESPAASESQAGSTPPASSGASASGTASGSEELEPVELIWYYPQAPVPADLQAVNDALNKITQERINATIKLQPVIYDNYATKLNTIVAANEAIDIIWTATWLFEWVPNQKKGVFQPLNELLESHGKKLFDIMPEKFWNDVKLDGQIYGVPGYQIAARQPSFVIQKRFADKYNLDPSTIKKPEDLEPFLKQVKAGEPDIVPFGIAQSWYDELLWGYDPFISVKQNDPNHQVITSVQSEEYKQYVTLMRSWYTQDLINKDAATAGDITAVISKGDVAAWYDYTGKPGSETDFKNRTGGHDVIMIPLSQPYFTGSASTMNAISRTSKNPERAMMFLELVNTDKEVYNLLSYGLEGKHYTKLDGEFIKVNPEAGYTIGSDWVFGNTMNGYLMEGTPADKYEQTKKVNDEAIVSPYYGFIFNTDPVKTELANVEAVNEEYSPGLDSGTVDPEKILPTYLDKQLKAGADRIAAEKQKQLDEWLEANGKK